MNAQRGVLLLLIAALLFLSFQLVQPYLSFVIGAVLLAYVLAPLQTRLEARVRSTTAAALLVVAVTLALLVPFVGLSVRVAGEAVTIARELAADDVAAGLQAPEAWLNERLARDIDLSAEIAARLEGLGETVLGTAPDLVASLTHLTIGLGLSVFLLFYLLRDGNRLVEWLQAITPLPQSVQETLYARLDSMTRAVLLGHVLVAIIQGGIAGLGLLVVGISNVLFWTVIMILLALLPFIGAFLVWGPAAVWLVSTGQTLAGVFLFIYGTIVVGVSDEYLRPVIVDRYANISPAVIVIGVIGGLSAFGVMGLFIGPIIVGALKASLEVFDEQYDRL
ncbi:AI-2E family transporter [Halohasta litorea]|uniref:AI-2E family transporter n=1 Tax=Halohasta litorea TaxID=869891 RepID=A0ABD6D899_9EURY|nr:AI-2E family transporter [Halohasta litorea]MEA1932097.1 AI-2E family transporter [Euryarchaeota archaeon]